MVVDLVGLKGAGSAHMELESESGEHGAFVGVGGVGSVQGGG